MKKFVFTVFLSVFIIPLYGGTIQYLSNSSSNTTAANIIVELRSTSTGAILLSDETDSSGIYSISIDSQTTYDVYIVAKNPRIQVGKSLDNRIDPVTVYDQYESYEGRKLGSEIGNFTISSNSFAFNFVKNFQEGYAKMASINLYPDYLVRIKYPNNSTGLNKGNRCINVSNEHLWSKDVFTHELGHLYMYINNADQSLGGNHSSNQHYDLRLAYSEGLANYISAYIRNDPNFESSLYNIGNVSTSSYMYTTNEVAIAAALWEIGTTHGHEKVWKTIIEIGKRTDRDTDQNANMDHFEVIWKEFNPTLDISAIFLKYSFPMKNDLASSYNQSTPYYISQVDLKTLSDLTWWPKSNEDWFSCNVEAGVTYTFKADNIKNGGLPSLRLFRSPGALIAEKDLDNIFDAYVTSTITYTPTQNETVLLKTSRFNDLTKNYGLGVDDQYKMSTGYYGSYDLTFKSNKKTVVNSDGSVTVLQPLPTTTITTSTSSSDLRTHLSQSVSASANTASERVTSIEKLLSAATPTAQEISSGNATSIIQSFTTSSNLAHGSGSSLVLMSDIPASSKAMITRITSASDLGISATNLSSAIYIVAVTDAAGVPIATPITLKIPKTNTANNEGTLVKISGLSLVNQSATVKSEGDYWTVSFVPASGYAVTGATTVPSAGGGGGGGGGCLLK